MRAAGLRDSRLGRPAIIIAIGVTVIVLGLSLIVTPLSKEKLDRETDFIKSNLSTLLLREGVFNDISDDLTVYIRDRVNVTTMRGILIHDRGSNNQPVTILAQQGKLYTPASGAPQIVITDGLRQEFDPNTGRLRRLTFDQYALDLGRFSSPPGPIRLDIDERSVFSLMADLQTDIGGDQRHEIIADLVSRTGLPLMTIGFAATALACLMAGDFSRRGNLRRILLALVIVTLLQGTGLALSNLIKDHLILAPLIYALAIGPAILAWPILSPKQNANSGRPL
jgi:lipopolysaccharide export system permease protein